MAAELMARTLLEVNAACCEVALRNRVLAVLMVGEAKLLEAKLPVGGKVDGSMVQRTC